MTKILQVSTAAAIISMIALQPALAQQAPQHGLRVAKSTDSNQIRSRRRFPPRARTASHGRPEAAGLQKMRLQRKLSFRIARPTQKKLETMQWTMRAGSDGRPILSGNRYRFENIVKSSGLKKQKRTFGANLGFLSSKSDAFNVKVQRKAGNGQVRYGDVVALYLGSYGWLKYKKQKVGINMSGSKKTVHYNWRITGGAPGTKLVAGMPFALHSLHNRRDVTYCKRTWGINLGYKGASKCGGLLGKVSTKIFGDNGLLAGDGLSGKAADLAKDHLCEMAVGAIGASIGVGSGGTAGAIAVAASTAAIRECKRL